MQIDFSSELKFQYLLFNEKAALEDQNYYYSPRGVETQTIQLCKRYTHICLNKQLLPSAMVEVCMWRIHNFSYRHIFNTPQRQLIINMNLIDSKIIQVIFDLFTKNSSSYSNKFDCLTINGKDCYQSAPSLEDIVGKYNEFQYFCATLTERNKLRAQATLQKAQAARKRTKTEFERVFCNAITKQWQQFNSTDELHAHQEDALKKSYKISIKGKVHRVEISIVRKKDMYNSLLRNKPIFINRLEIFVPQKYKILKSNILKTYQKHTDFFSKFHECLLNNSKMVTNDYTRN